MTEEREERDEPDERDERAPSESTDKLSASVEEIERAIESAMARLDAERKAEAGAAAAKDRHKTQVSNRVSIAALLLTMMLSFLGFLRAGEDSASTDDKTIVQQSKNDAASEWSLYQTKQAQREGLVEAEDAIERSVLNMKVDDPGRRLARFNHREYAAKVRLVDDENRQVFHRIQSLNTREYHAQRDADHHDRRKDRYDMGIRTLTLALVLISVTLLVDREYMFWSGLLIAAIGAVLGFTGYFLR